MSDSALLLKGVSCVPFWDDGRAEPESTRKAIVNKGINFLR